MRQRAPLDWYWPQPTLSISCSSSGRQTRATDGLHLYRYVQCGAGRSVQVRMTLDQRQRQAKYRNTMTSPIHRRGATYAGRMAPACCWHPWDLWKASSSRTGRIAQTPAIKHTGLGHNSNQSGILSLCCRWLQQICQRLE